MLMAMEGVALECMQMEVGWGEWASQVEHSSTVDRGWLHGWMHCIRPFVRVPQFELRFACDMRAIWRCDGVPWDTYEYARVNMHALRYGHIPHEPQFELPNAHIWTYTVPVIQSALLSSTCT